MTAGGHRTVARFPIRLGRRSRPLLLLFGVREGNADVTLEGGVFLARFGFYRLRTPIANIARWRIEGPFRWITAIGVRRSVRGGDVTYGGSHHGGVRVDFRERVPWLRGLLRTPALYVTVGDLEGLAAELARLGIPGDDVRNRDEPAPEPPEPAPEPAGSSPEGSGGLPG
jgi:hypothetical protein